MQLFALPARRHIPEENGEETNRREKDHLGPYMLHDARRSSCSRADLALHPSAPLLNVRSLFEKAWPSCIRVVCPFALARTKTHKGAP